MHNASNSGRCKGMGAKATMMLVLAVIVGTVLRTVMMAIAMFIVTRVRRVLLSLPIGKEQEIAAAAALLL